MSDETLVEAYSRELRGDIVRRTLRIISESPNRQSTWYMNHVESTAERHQNPVYGFTVYSEARMSRRGPAMYEDVPVAEIWLPDADLPDGTPTERFYAVEQDGRLHGGREKAVFVGDWWGDGEFIEEWDDLTIEQRQALLAEIAEIDPVNL